MIFFLVRVALFLALLYLLYSFYKSSKISAGRKVSKKNIIACPSPKIFIDYTEGKIKGKKKKDIDRHIAQCKNCQEALKEVFDLPKNEGPNSKGTV